MQWPRELARQLTHPLALLLCAAALLSFIVGSITVAVAVVLIIVLNAAVAFVQERHAENAVEALAGYIPQKVTVMRDGTRKVVEAAELVPGDIALVEEGERIAADMRLISGAVESTSRRSPARPSRRCARRSITTARAAAVTPAPAA